MELISIIIPTRNRAKTLEISLINYISMLNYYLKDSYELVVVNDYSDDDTAQILESLKIIHPYLRCLNLSKNLGPGLARQAGLEISLGKWIWYVDDDDYINLEKIDLKINLNKDTDIVCHSLKNTYENIDHSRNKSDLIKNLLLFKENQEVFNFIFSKNFLLENSIVFSTGYHEDIRYVIEAAVFANEINFLNRKIYYKIQHDDSITSKFNIKRIDGYFNAYFELRDLIDKNAFFIEKKLFINAVLEQIIGVILYLIYKIADQEIVLIEYLKDTIIKNKLLGDISLNNTSKNTNFKFAASTFVNGVINGLKAEELLFKSTNIFSTFLSCKDLNSSLFLAPNEIRACCKRFFVNGIQKGDIVLMEASKDVSLNKILSQKKDLIKQINREEFEGCSGCPYIERFDSKVNHEEVNYISFENFSYCNMRCTYCSPKYYAGKEALYDTTNIIDNLITSNKLGSDTHVVFGGGEPTISPNFSKLINTLVDKTSVKKIRVLSNSLKFSPTIFDTLKNAKVQLVTSIDAGTNLVFKEIRGKGDLETVLKNLSFYKESARDVNPITVKYIFTNKNYFSYELEQFVSKIIKYDLIDCMFQISCDFTQEKLGLDVIKGFYELSVRLKNAGVEIVFFDDLIRDRLQINKDICDSIFQHLDKHNINQQHILSYKSSKKIILFGKGLQSNWILKKTTYGCSNLIISVVENILSNELSDSESIPIMPTGVQAMTELVNLLVNAGYKERLESFIIL